MRWLLLALPLAACSAPKEPPPDPPSPAETKAEYQAHMDEHLSAAADARNAVVRGDLAGAGKALDWLSQHVETEPAPADWRPHLKAMREAAAQPRTNVAEAAQAVAGVAAACGACHGQAGATPPLTPPPKPVASEGSAAHMARHRYALRRLWEGLVLPSDDAWNQGLAALAEGSMEAHELSEPDKLDDKTKELEAAVHAMAAEALTEAPEQRPARFAAVLTACAQCHSATGGGPGGAPAASAGDAPAAPAGEAPAAEGAADPHAH